MNDIELNIRITNENKIFNQNWLYLLLVSDCEREYSHPEPKL